MRYLYRDALFRIDTPEQQLCLTFDDGPDPHSTLLLLEILRHFRIKALFFCNGEKAHHYPDLVKRILNEGHKIGNHGYNHLNGWWTPTQKYCKDVRLASQYTSCTLFRPPYGRIRIRQYRQLRKEFKIVFWDIMPYDFDLTLGPVRSLGIMLNKVRRGSIIVLHDKPGSLSLEILDEFLSVTESKGYKFVIPPGLV